MPLSIKSIDEEIADLRRQMKQIAETIHALESLKSALQPIQNQRNGVGRASPPIRNRVPSKAPAPSAGGVAPIENATAAIREAIANCGPSFTIDDVAALLEQAGIDTIARTTISQTLSEWSRKGKIGLKHHGTGTVPSVYRKSATVAQLKLLKRKTRIGSKI